MIIHANKYILSISLLLFINSTILPTESLVKTINKEDQLLSLIDRKQPTIIMGTMGDVCIHCKRISPFFDNLSKKHKSISFFKANGITTKMHEHIKAESAKQGTDFKIIGYPSFVFIKDKKIINLVTGGDQVTLEEAVKNFLKSCNHKKS